VNVRPYAALAPSTSKKSVVTRPIRSSSGFSPVIIVVFDQIPPIPANDVVRSRRSSGTRGGEWHASQISAGQVVADKQQFFSVP